MTNSILYMHQVGTVKLGLYVNMNTVLSEYLPYGLEKTIKNTFKYTVAGCYAKNQTLDLQIWEC